MNSDKLTPKIQQKTKAKLTKSEMNRRYNNYKIHQNLTNEEKQFKLIKSFFKQLQNVDFEQSKDSQPRIIQMIEDYKKNKNLKTEKELIEKSLWEAFLGTMFIQTLS